MAPTTTLIVTVNLECCRCSSKVQKILCCIQQEGEFTIEKIVYEKDKVLVTGPFDADKLSSKLWCKAGRIIKDIQVAKPKDDEPKKHKPEPPSCKLVYPCYPNYYPFQLCPQQQPSAWPCSGGCPHPHCGCQPKPPPPPVPPPPPPPPKPPACQCSTWPSCYCGGYPPPMPYPMIVCDDSPPYGACTVM